MKIKKAVVLSAGYGRRLNPITLSIPKPLIKIKNTTLLENTINILQELGIEEIVINTHYLSDQINEFIKNKKFDAKISLIHEDKKILMLSETINHALSVGWRIKKGLWLDSELISGKRGILK